MEDYEPYSDEWEKEMMKLPKKELIAMVRRIKKTKKGHIINLEKISKYSTYNIIKEDI